MATEHFCLRWNNHQSTLVSVFDNLLESGTLVDCTLAADGRYLKAHKVVLSACSPYLGMLLSQHYDKHPIIILKDVKFDELKAMLDYMYRGEVNISQEQLSTFLKAAETLQIKGLTDAGSDEGNGLQPNRPPSSNSTTSANEDPQSPGPPGEGGSSPGPRKRKRNKHGDDGEGDSASKISLSEGSDRLSGTSVGSPSAKSASVKREPGDGEGDGQMSVDDSGEVVMMSRPGPSNGGTNNKAPWILSADSSGEEMQLTPGQGGGGGSQQQYLQMQQMMQQMYGGMWMDNGGSNSGQTPTDMEQEMLAAYRYGRPNWNANRYLCTNCGRTYSLQASLYNHKKFECGKLPNFICPYCPHRTKQKGNLKTHIKKRHPEFFSEPFMPSPSRLNSMMNSIMMQSSMMQQNMSMMNSQPPTSQMQGQMHNALVQSTSRMQNSTQNYMQNSSKSPSINNLLQAMKSMPQNSSSGQNPNALANANFIQALAQSLPNSTSISPLDIMQVLAQGSQTTPKSPMTPHIGMSPKNTSQSNYNPSQSPMPSSRMSPMNASPASTNPPQSPMAANVTPTVNGGTKSEPKDDTPDDASDIHDAPKSPPASNFTSLSLEPADSDDSSDVLVLPSYPVSQ